jgi:hypothetical protein
VPAPGPDILAAMRHAAGIVVALACCAGTARADEPITDRNYAIDLYQGAAIGTVRIVGMGGTSLAVSEGSAGVLANPASAAVRRTTSIRHWDWNFHLDALSAVYASDFDNNGRNTGDEGARVATFGIAGQKGPWGLAFTAITTSARLGGTEEPLDGSAQDAKVALARSFGQDEITVGIATRFGAFSIEKARGDDTLITIGGFGFEAGAVWRPPGQSWRLGGSMSLPISGSDIDDENCDPLDCEGFILPERIVVPWQIAVGVAWRGAPTPWNKLYPPPFRDEDAILVGADLVITGSVDDGYGVEAFADKQLQRSGRDIALSARLGAEWECIPGHLRLRGGTYWEPGRFDDVGGRPHLTLGIEGGYVDFRFFGLRRLRLSLTGDIARRYGNAGFSVGFWH